MTLENDIRSYCKSEGIKYDFGAGRRSSNQGNSAYFFVTPEDKGRIWKFFSRRLREQAERFDLLIPVSS